MPNIERAITKLTEQQKGLTENDKCYWVAEQYVSLT